MSKTDKSEPTEKNPVPEHETVQITIHGLLSLVEPALPFLLPHLEYELTITSEGGPLGYQGRKQPIPMCEIVGEQVLMISTGLVPRVKRVLVEHGYAAKINDHREFGKRFTVNESLLDQTDDENDRFLRAVRKEPMGQVAAGDFHDVIEKMRLIINLYPKARVLILTGKPKSAWKIQTELNRANLGFRVRRRKAGTVWPHYLSRCVVSSFLSLGSCPVNEFQVVLLSDPAGAVSEWGAGGMHELARPPGIYHRVYSFLLPGLRLGRRGRLRLESISGELIYRPASSRCDVQVLWLKTPDCARFDECEGLAFKQKAYWQNDRRNEFIASVARAFANRDLHKLQKYGIPFHDDEPILRHTPHTKIAVLVESTVQGQEFVRRLPEWTFLHAKPEKGEVESTENDSKTLPPGWIVTEVKAATEKIDADVIIRADGGTGRLLLKDFPPVISADEERNPIVVDFDDKFHADAALAAQRRRRGYEIAGWEEI